MKKLLVLLLLCSLLFLAACDKPLDVDLTAMSSTMVYAEVLNMMNTPSSYIGKNVRMRGSFSIYEDPNGQIFFACLIADATACCSQGIEFVLAGDHVYPDDYPDLGTTITVTGTFDTYYDGPTPYCHLKDAAMEVG